MLEQRCWKMSVDERERGSGREVGRERERERFVLMVSLMSSPEENMLLAAADVLTSDPS